jgi:hypothetical protein
LFKQPTTRSRKKHFFTDTPSRMYSDSQDPRMAKLYDTLLPDPPEWNGSRSSLSHEANTTTTTGGGPPESLHADLIALFPTEGRFYFQTERLPDRLIIWRRDQQSLDTPEVVGDYPMQPDDFLHTDQTGTAFRVWRSSKAQIDMARPGLATGRDVAQAIGDRAARIRQINDRNTAAWNR